MVSYEVSIGFVLLCVVLFAGTFNLSGIVLAQKGNILGIISANGLNPLLFPMAVVFFISSLAETARTPFDLTEAESEASGATGTGILDMTCPIVKVWVAGASVMTAEPVPATLDATTASSEAADAAFADAALVADAGAGAATNAGAMVTVPVGIEAVAGSWIEVVKPCIAMGTMRPGDSVEGWT